MPLEYIGKLISKENIDLHGVDHSTGCGFRSSGPSADDRYI